MHKDSREKFPMVEHTQAQRTADGIARAPSIRLRERLLHEGTLRCATCPRLPSNGHGTLHFIIDSTTEEAPSSTTLKRLGFLEEKIKDGKAQILCRDCELTKTYELKKHDNIRSCVASRLRVRGGQQCRAFHDLRYVL
jgi:hypothetical protein